MGVEYDAIKQRVLDGTTRRNVVSLDPIGPHSDLDPNATQVYVAVRDDIVGLTQEDPSRRSVRGLSKVRDLASMLCPRSVAPKVFHNIAFYNLQLMVIPLFIGVDPIIALVNDRAVLNPEP